jgi:cobalt/nickel transport system ATP-binding protein
MDLAAPLIACEGLCFAYAGGAPVLDGASFTLAAGERLGLTGANGSGKSTLLRMLVGLLRPAAGEVRVFGEPRVSEQDFMPVRAGVGLLFQDPDDQLFCPTVGEDVAFGPLNLGKSAPEVEAAVKRALAQVGLEGFEDRVSHHLSGGEKRLAALAGVLAMAPRVLLLDEPLAGLDEAAAERIANVLAGLPQAMVIVAHDQPFLDRLATRHVCLQKGRITAG